MSFLEKLPREIRDHIYDFVYESVIEHCITITTASAKQYSEPASNSWLELDNDPNLALLSANRQIRDEASPTLFRRATLEGTMGNVLPFLEAIGQNRHHLQKIKLREVLGPDRSSCDFNDSGERNHNSLRRTLNLLSNLKALRFLSIDLGGKDIYYNEALLMENGVDQLIAQVHVTCTTSSYCVHETIIFS